MFRHLLSIAILAVALAGAAGQDARKPTLYIIGDSTVKNGTKGQQGWGTPLAGLFDMSKIKVENRALGGRSSRTFRTEGLWGTIGVAPFALASRLRHTRSIARSRLIRPPRVFSDRDGVAKRELADIGYERRNGYAWLRNWPQRLLEKEYPAWKAKR